MYSYLRTKRISVNTAVVLSIASEIVKDSSLLASNGGHVSFIL